MSKFRKHNHRPDENQKQIVDALRSIGVSVDVGHDDILCGWQGSTYWIELKSKKGAKVQESQEKLIKEWKGHYSIAYTLDDVLKELGIT